MQLPGSQRLRFKPWTQQPHKAEVDDGRCCELKARENPFSVSDSCCLSEEVMTVLTATENPVQIGLRKKLAHESKSLEAN